MSDRVAFGRARAMIRNRAGRPPVEDVWYRVYLAALVLAVVAFPLIRAAVVGLALPGALSSLEGQVGSAALAVTLAVAAGLLFAAARSRGPVVPTEPYIHALVASALPRRRTLRRPFTAGVALVVAAVLLPCTVLIASSAAVRVLDPWGVGLVLAGCLALGVLLSVTWLVGQLPARERRPAAAVIVAVIVLQVAGAVVPALAPIAAWLTPWGWMGVLGSAVGGIAGEHLIAIGLLALTAVAAATAIPGMLDRLERDDLAAQAARWNAASSLAVTGDIGTAARRLAALPRRGRRWRVLPLPGAVGALVARDILGIVRFPLRAVLGALATSAGAAVIALGVGGGSELLAAFAAVAMYFSVGALCGGLRLFGATLGGSSPYGVPPGRQIGAHLIAPAILSVFLATLGAGAGVVLAGAPAWSLAWAVLVAVLAVVLQLLTAVKGPLPVALRMPVPTPVGDMSVVSVGLWMADAVVVMALVGGGLTLALAGTGAFVVAAVALTILAAGIALWAAVRFDRLLRTW